MGLILSNTDLILPDSKLILPDNTILVKKPDVKVVSTYDKDIAIPWAKVNPEINNPVRNTNHDYLRFVNTTYFSEEARRFLRYGYYTDAEYGTRDYNEYWDIQEDRVLNGYSVGGVRIPGRYYYFLNFCQLKARPIDPVTGLESRAKKIITFPRFLDHQYYFFLELEECYAEGPYEDGKLQGICIFKSRRKGFTYVVAGGIFNYNFNFVSASMNVLAAYQKDFYKVTLDGIHFTLNHTNKRTDWAKRRDRLDQRDHFRASFVTKNDLGMDIEDGYMSEIHAISFKDDPFKSIGECLGKGTGILMYNGSVKNVEDIVIGDKVMGVDSTPRTVLSTHSGIDDLYEIIPTKGDSFIVNSRHKNVIYDEYVTNVPWIKTTNELLNRTKWEEARQKLILSSGISFDDKDVAIDPYILGVWLGDGNKDSFGITTMDNEIVDSLKEYIDKFNGNFTLNKISNSNSRASLYRLGTKTKFIYTITKDGVSKEFNSFNNISKYLNADLSNIIEAFSDNRKIKGYTINRVDAVSPYRLLKNLNLINNKHIPDSYLYNTVEKRLQLLAGIIDTDGYLNKSGTCYEIAQKDDKLAKQIVYLCRSLGFYVKVSVRTKIVNSKECKWNRIMLTGNIHTIPARISRKKATIKDSRLHSVNRTTFKVKSIGKGEYYGFELDGDKLFMLDNFIITHNSTYTIGFEEAGKFPGLLSSLTIAEPTYRDGDDMTGIPIIWGSAGDEGAVLDLEELFYNPKPYGLKSYSNIYDENSTGDCGFFIDDLWYHQGRESATSTHYMVDAQGNSDRQGSEKLLDAKRELRKGGNKTSYNLFITQQPKTPAEGFLKSQGTIFDTVTAKSRLADILINKKRYSDTVLKVKFKLNKDGKPVWYIDDQNEPIHEFPLKDNKNKIGVIEIFTLPVRDSNGNIPRLRYISGIDSYDDDASDTTSVGSCWILDRFTDKIVAIYKGRPDTTEFYEQCRLLLLYYNATANYERRNKGIYGHFFNKNSLHLMCDEPDILKDRGISNANTEGNNLKGTYPSTPVLSYGNTLMVAYLNAKAQGHDESSEITNLMELPTISGLREIIYWSPDPRKNYDDIAALRMLVIYRENLIKYEVSKMIKEQSDVALSEYFLRAKKKGIYGTGYMPRRNYNAMRR